MIAEIHDQILLNLFTNFSASKSITRVIHNFSINADKFLVIIFSLVKTLPWLYQKGINFIALVIPDENLNQRAVFLIDPRNNQLLGINQICYQLTGLCNLFTYDHNKQLSMTTFTSIFPDFADFSIA